MTTFDKATLDALRDLREVAVRTEKRPGSAVTIWVVVDGDAVFVRSVKGPLGRWYKDLAQGGPATLEFRGRGVAVQAVPATDADSVARASRQYLAKYRDSPYAESMVRPDVLPTTLRLDPR
ncbi:MAG TPA: DUF2255 family protein [Acetobacteraceae bacterium]|nr:DUF2255 family protein [Acetobacteraceae bacterium]